MKKALTKLAYFGAGVLVGVALEVSIITFPTHNGPEKAD